MLTAIVMRSTGQSVQTGMPKKRNHPLQENQSIAQAPANSPTARRKMRGGNHNLSTVGLPLSYGTAATCQQGLFLFCHIAAGNREKALG